MSDVEVICGSRLAGCRCGLPPGHGGDVHECAEPDPTCGGAWKDHPTDPNTVFVVRWPGTRPGGPNSGLRSIPDPIWPLEMDRC